MSAPPEGAVPRGPHEESLLVQAEHAVAHAGEVLLHGAEEVFALPDVPESPWHHEGPRATRTERLVSALGGFVLLVLTVAWAWSITVFQAEAHVSGEAAGAVDGGGVSPVTSAIATALTDADAPTAAYLTDFALDRFFVSRGASGKLLARLDTAGARVGSDTLPDGAEIRYRSRAGAESTAVGTVPRSPGVWSLVVRMGEVVRPLTDFSVITMLPRSAKRGGRVGLYYIGNWPGEKGGRVRAGYEPPAGFIQVTPENQETRVSEHFRLRDFLTHNQPNVWPKYLVLGMKNVDKLELVLGDLASRGIDVSGVTVMSGFRTPQYNRSGGDPSGRAALSRHMYGDAADVFIDSNRDGTMDDLNHDGRVDIGDARVIQSAVDRVERAHPELVGGCGVYVASGGHGPFTHIDTRGYRARWVSSGGDS